VKLNEGGNVFKDVKGTPLTTRVAQTDVPATIAWLEQLLGIDLPRDRWLGSTGKAPTSGDLDIAIYPGELTKEQLQTRLSNWAETHKQDPRDWVRKSGEAVHFKTPITGRPGKGYVQTDFMFLHDPVWGSFYQQGGANSAYKGLYRNVLMSSLAKFQNKKITNRGLVDRSTNQVIETDPDEIAKAVLNPRATARDLTNVESIYAALKSDPKKKAKVADFEAYLEREGLESPDGKQKVKEDEDETEVNFLARLRDRIVNQGMQVIIEGKEVRIPHLEDLVFDAGTAGIRRALEIAKQAAANTASTTTIKWDGKPAIIFGRNPNGNFVLTDKSGFTAKGYDGLATSPAQIEKIMQMRGGERGELIEIYKKLFPLLKAAVPPNFKGYIQGDLLYTSKPPVQAGLFVFRPNFITYKIPVNSELGQQINNSEVGVAIHTYYENPESPAQVLGHVNLKSVPGLMLVKPTVETLENVKLNRKLMSEIKQLVQVKGAAINTLFNPNELRTAQLTDLPALAKKYINSRITTNYDNLLPDFMRWMQANVTPRKYANFVEYLKSPRSNADGLAAAFTAFLALHDLKTDMLDQLDRQYPGQEGWVAATDAGRAKLVNRFGFSAGNKLLNNPELVK
jgi:hypothetical protein